MRHMGSGNAERGKTRRGGEIGKGPPSHILGGGVLSGGGVGGGGAPSVTKPTLPLTARSRSRRSPEPHPPSRSRHRCGRSQLGPGQWEREMGEQQSRRGKERRAGGRRSPARECRLGCHAPSQTESAALLYRPAPLRPARRACLRRCTVHGRIGRRLPHACPRSGQ